MPTLITTKALAAKLSVGRSTVWRFVKEDPSFPRPVHLTARSVRWDDTDVDKWIASIKESKEHTNEIA